ncbi:hypothetical protein GCM10009548_73900 [Streptomyces malaysiensis subsp. malaysiensis]
MKAEFGYDAGKKINGRKRHLVVDTRGLPLIVMVTPADLHDAVSRPKDASGFIVLPRRWVVERSLAWMMQPRRRARDYERLIQHSETLITWAAITLMTRRLARKGATPSRPGQPASADS